MSGASAGETTTPLLVVDGVSKDYRLAGATHRVLNDVSVSLAPGRVLGVVGESGSGKTTLGHIVAGVLDATEGEVTVTAPGKDDSAVQIIFQESAAALDPRMPVWKSVAESVAKSGIIRKKHFDSAMRYIDYVGLTESDAVRRPGDLSGGQRQRVSIARALAAEPALLVCDEAVSALDVSVRATVLNLLNRVRRDLGVGLLFISHDMAVVGHMADDVLVLQNGNVMEYGPSGAVLNDPVSEYTRQLVEATPSLERQLLETTGEK